MTKLAEAVRENVGESSYVMRGFFEDLIGKGELGAYLVEVNKQIVEVDTEEKTIIRTMKGATLTSTDELREYLGYIVEDLGTGIKYNLDIGCMGGMFFNDGNSQTTYHHCVLERLTEELDFRRINGKSSLMDSVISIPEEFVFARLRVDYDENEDNDCITRVRKSLTVEGEVDELFKKVIDYVRDS